jgi:hypothetical protein
MVVASVGCGADRSWEEPGPSTVFERFLMAWSQQQREQAYEMIDPADREVLEGPLDELSASVPDEAVPSASEMLVTGRVDHPFDLENIKVDNLPDGEISNGHRVRLSLTYFDERKGEATLVWRGDQWFVDLPLDDGSGTSSGTSQ